MIREFDYNSITFQNIADNEHLEFICDGDKQKVVVNYNRYFMTNNDSFVDMLQTYFPPFLQQFLNKFAVTKFYKKTLENRRSSIDESIEYYYFFDWECLDLSPYKSYSNYEKVKGLLRVGRFGLIPNYQHDELKTIVIDFRNKEAYLERGLAIKPYASYVLKHRQEIPKYMQPLIDKLWVDYDNYIRSEESECR